MTKRIDSSNPAALLKAATRLERLVREKEVEVRSKSAGLKWRKELASLPSSDILTQGIGARRVFWMKTMEATGVAAACVPVFAPVFIYAALRVPRGEQDAESRLRKPFRDHAFAAYHFADKLLARPDAAHQELGAATAALRAAELGLKSAQAQHAQILQKIEDSRANFRPLLANDERE